jgi:general secretion pathway protein C
MLRSVRVVPEARAGAVVGLRLFGVKPGSLLDTLGIRNGDRLETINGFRVANPEQALIAYARLRSASRLVVHVERRGVPVELDYRID